MRGVDAEERESAESAGDRCGDDGGKQGPSSVFPGCRDDPDEHGVTGHGNDGGGEGERRAPCLCPGGINRWGEHDEGNCALVCVLGVWRQWGQMGASARQRESPLSSPFLGCGEDGCAATPLHPKNLGRMLHDPVIQAKVTGPAPICTNIQVAHSKGKSRHRSGAAGNSTLSQQS
ncbi:hypothetical protein B0H17DRAFT_1147124 [Mycena rosella]|uniref:Uncharacterized protein n=1 Tax=Mycena rosella TaxID=1033263 RepID=A0AAD7CPT3_MYCRO|nr:hypothetical protein B0H17DRAFT_1147124 [Mycena rosella]